jgi:hypothetical protein
VPDKHSKALRGSGPGGDTRSNRKIDRTFPGEQRT